MVLLGRITAPLYASWVRLQVSQQIQELLQQAATVEAEITPQAAALQHRLDAICAQVDILEEAMGHD